MWRYPRRPTPEGTAERGRESATRKAVRAELTEAEAVAAVMDAAHEAADQLTALADRIYDAGRADDAGIFDAQAMMATDTAILDEAIRLIRTGMDPVEAVAESATAAAEMLAAVDDELISARAADIRDVGARIGRILRGEQLDLPEQPSVAVADDLPPSVTAEIPTGLLLGVALAGGSRTSHAVILSRGLGIPCVVGATGLLQAIDAATDAVVDGAPTPIAIAVDGQRGEILLEPSDDDIVVFQRRADALAERTRRAAALRDRPGATADGERVALLANIGTPDDAPRALEARAEGVGLFRTEFLYMKRQTPPTEHEQMLAYRRVMTAFGPDRPVVIRLADIGGDKGIPYLGLPAEANPFLGVRAIRLAYRSHDLLRTQLRAIWQAGALAKVTPHIMAPMVATVADVKLLQQLRDEARDDVRSKKLPCAKKMVTGIMVEIPSAAILAAELARLIDFFSIGTNDLVQYLLTTDRTSNEVASYYEPLHPAVLQVLASLATAAKAKGKSISVCGEMAGNPAYTQLLLGLGFRSLSVSPSEILEIKNAIRSTSLQQAEHLARRLLQLDTIQEIKDCLRDEKAPKQ